MEKEEKVKPWWKQDWIWSKAIPGIITGISLGLYLSTRKENRALKEENLKLKGANENYKTQVKGNIKTIEKISYFLGKKQNSLT